MLRPIINRRNQEAVMGLGEHLEELRRRVIYALIALVPVFVVLFYFGEPLLEIVIQPMRRSLIASGQSANLIATGAVETFAAVLKLAAVTTLVICGPWVIYQAWRFVAPGLYAHERRFAYILAPLSVVLSVSAVLFMYYVMFPVLLLFLVNYGSHVGANLAVAPPPADTVFGHLPILDADPPAPAVGDTWINRAVMEIRVHLPGPDGTASNFAVPLARSSGISVQPRVVEFVGLFLTMALGFVIAFQTPAVVLLLGWVGLLRLETMSAYRRHVIVVCAVLGAILTPSPDPFSMILMTVPLYLLYELGLILLRLLPASRIAPGEDDSPNADNPGSQADAHAALPAAGRTVPRGREPPGGPADGP